MGWPLRAGPQPPAQAVHRNRGTALAGNEDALSRPSPYQGHPLSHLPLPPPTALAPIKHKKITGQYH